VFAHEFGVMRGTGTKGRCWTWVAGCHDAGGVAAKLEQRILPFAMVGTVFQEKFAAA
jgi:hypothetical protein